MSRALKFSIVALSFFLSFTALDLMPPIYHHPSFLNAACRTLVIDLPGVLQEPIGGGEVVILKKLGIDDFRVLGASKADIIIYVGHGLEANASGLFISLGDYAIETSEPYSIYAGLMHLGLSSLGAIGRGYIPFYGEELVVVTSNIMRFSLPFKDKVFVLITCGSEKAVKFAEAILRSGAKLVAFRGRHELIDACWASHVVRELLAAQDLGELKLLLEGYGFAILERDEELFR